MGELRNNVLIAPIFAIAVNEQNDQFIDFNSHSVNLIIGETKQSFEHSLIEEGRSGDESLEDIYDLAFDPPVVSL